MVDGSLNTDVAIAGGGLAGIVAAYELLDRGKKVVLVDKDVEENFGGLAKESFGGVHLIGTRQQRRLKIHDHPQLAYDDWQRRAKFAPGDHWPRKWAQCYCEQSGEVIGQFLEQQGVRFLPVVNWPERGAEEAGNSVPRWHIAWGTGHEIIRRLLGALDAHRHRAGLKVLFLHAVAGVEMTDGRATGLFGTRLCDGAEFRIEAEHVVIASGGICGGDLSKARANWPPEWPGPPNVLLNGAHKFGDGLLHDRIAELGGNVTHLDKQWHYAAGIHHPAKRRPADGLSLVPPRSALWFNALGQRIGPPPLVSYTDTGRLVERVLAEPGQYSWHVMNWKIAIKELAVSGGDYMTAFRYRRKGLLVKHLLFGNKDLVRRLIRECPEDIVVADRLPELVDEMNQRGVDGHRVDGQVLADAIAGYDAEIERGKAYFNDEQLRRIMSFRTYRGDRIRTCKFRRILDPKAAPLLAIRQFILCRKSLGGIQTDLSCRVLRPSGDEIPGLYAIGEAAGFGGGGIHGRGSLEGSFLGSCVLTGRAVGQAIGKGERTARR